MADTFTFEPLQFMPFRKYFYSELDPAIRPPESRIVGPANKNINEG